VFSFSPRCHEQKGSAKYTTHFTLSIVFSWRVNYLSLPAVIVSKAPLNGINKAMVAAVTVFADLSSTRVETVKLVLHTTIVTSTSP
jgi:hypothetical protein